MIKKTITFIFSWLLILSFVSTSSSFDNKANIDEDGSWIPYSLDNINQGLFKGGHDTLTVEGMKLKRETHKNDPLFQEWSKENGEVLRHLRIGAHDEDSTKSLDFLIHDPPIGSTSWGGFFNHFYNYRKDKKGFKG